MIFLHKEVGILEAAKESYLLTKGNVLMIFLSALVVGIIVFAISIVLQLLAQGIGMVLDLALGTSGVFSIIFSARNPHTIPLIMGEFRRAPLALKMVIDYGNTFMDAGFHKEYWRKNCRYAYVLLYYFLFWS